jgi:hypothetical protein
VLSRLAAERSKAETWVVKRILDLIGMSIGGWLGWTAGAPISFFSGFILGVVGTGAALYVMRRLTRGLP